VYIGEAGSDDDKEWSSSASRQACEQKGVPLVCLSQARQKSPKQSITVEVGRLRYVQKSICFVKGTSVEAHGM
jgi:hypothetical protein